MDTVDQNQIKAFINYFDSLKEEFIFAEYRATDVFRNLTVQEIRAIYHIGRSRNIMMRDLAFKLHLAVSSTTALVNKLVARELVVRKRSEEDRRILYISLTRKSQKIYDKTMEALMQTARKVLFTLNAEERESLIKILRKTAYALSSSSVKEKP